MNLKLKNHEERFSYNHSRFGGGGTAEITVSADPNPTFASRSTSLNFSAGGGISKSLNVSQLGVPFVFNNFVKLINSQEVNLQNSNCKFVGGVLTFPNLIFPIQAVSSTEFPDTIGITTSIPKELSGRSEDSKTVQITRVPISGTNTIGIDITSLSLVIQLFRDDLNTYIVDVIDELTEDQLSRTFIQLEYNGAVIVKSLIY